MGLHDGHRNRLKNRFLNEGLTNFEDHNVLELLLFYSIPRSDTNEIAHELLNKFGSLHGVFEAGMEDLMSINGISRHSAVLIKMAGIKSGTYKKSILPMMQNNFLFQDFTAKSEKKYSLFFWMIK